MANMFAWGARLSQPLMLSASLDLTCRLKKFPIGAISAIRLGWPFRLAEMDTPLGLRGFSAEGGEMDALLTMIDIRPRRQFN